MFENTLTLVQDRLACLEKASGEDTGTALQDRLAALERGVPVPPPAAVHAHTTSATSPVAMSFESAVQEAQLRNTHNLDVCISKLALCEETPDNIQVLTENFLHKDLHMDTADNQVSAVKRMRGKGDKPGILIVTCKSAHQRNLILKAAKQLKGRRIYVHPNWTKLQEQFRLRQLRREALARGEKAYFKTGQLIILTGQQATPTTTHSATPPTFLAAAATTPAAAPNLQ